MERIVIIGALGAGKTTLAAKLSRTFDIRFVEADALLWQRNGARPLSEFRAAMSEAVKPTRWIIDGSYSKLRDITWRQADTLVWLDYSLPVVVFRVVRRTVWRIIKRDEPWHGGSMTTLKLGMRIIRTAVRKWFTNRKKYESYLLEEQMQHLRVLRFRSPRQTQHWLESL